MQIDYILIVRRINSEITIDVAYRDDWLPLAVTDVIELGKCDHGVSSLS